MNFVRSNQHLCFEMLVVSDNDWKKLLSIFQNVKETVFKMFIRLLLNSMNLGRSISKHGKSRRFDLNENSSC